MNRKELSQIRHQLGKTQMQMAHLLNVSVKSIQSFEQGWRPSGTKASCRWPCRRL